MKKKKNRTLFGLFIVLLLVIVSIAFYFVYIKNSNNRLTLQENKWIDSNKYNVIDIALMNDVPVISYDGSGIVYDYFKSVTDQLSLKFNFITYKIDANADYNYKMNIVDTPSNTDLILAKDNMIIVTNKKIQYNMPSSINNLKLGVLKSDKEIISNYLSGENIEYVEFTSYSELIQAFNNSDFEQKIDSIIIPKIIFTKSIISNNYVIGFQFNDINKYFVLNLNGPVELNNILTKKYNSWKKDNYESSYNISLLNNYFEFKNISDLEQKKMNSKSYTFGFIDYGIFNYINKNKLSGINSIILKNFANFSGLAIKYIKYNSLGTLSESFNSSKIDFMLNISSKDLVSTELLYNTYGILNKKLAIISGNLNKVNINSFLSLKGKEVLTIKNSYLEALLINNGIKVISYNNLKDLTKEFKIDSIAIVDLENYNYYKTSAFKDCKIDYLINSDEMYNFVINNIEENKTFENLFNFYISYESISNLISSNYESVAYQNINIIYILIIIIVILCIYLVLDFFNHIKFMFKRKKKNKKIRLTKEEKIRYIDQLTSLKNRAYLNSRIEAWDDSEIYPQAIIVIDLNNISYINDNYGREEGDKIITEAANILIQNQLSNTEIIRTDGNEFLIYLVGYSEKQVISYIRKLNKELKTLSHGFGAASGYSIITDAIKTFDDAVNEATIDMKENKEDINY